MDWREKEKQRLREKLETETYEKDGALYWSVAQTWNPPQERLVPYDTFRDAGVAAPVNQRKALAEESARFIAAYREAQANYVPTREEEAERQFELRAAFGPGVEVVDVFTGKKTRT